MLCESADPHVDVIHACNGGAAYIRPGAGAEHKFSAVCGWEDIISALITAYRVIDINTNSQWIVAHNAIGTRENRAIHNPISRSALACQRCLCKDNRVRAIGCNKVDQRLGVLERLTEVDPVGIGCQLTIIRYRENLLAEII